MRAGINEYVGEGGCRGVLLLHIVCGFVCIAFMQAPLSTISLSHYDFHSSVLKCSPPG